MLNPPSNVPDPVAQLEQLQAHQAKVSKPKSCCDHSDDEEEEDDVMAKIKQSSNSQMSDVLLELETFLFWNRNAKERGYCVFAETVEEDHADDDQDAIREATQQQFRVNTTENLENVTKLVKNCLKEVKPKE